jgi:hypothetical protein
VAQGWDDEEEELEKEETEAQERQGLYDGKLGMRHFKYRTREGDLLAKIMGTDLHMRTPV